MQVTIIGTGNMARGVGTRALAGGHDVTVVGKDEAMAEEAAGALREAGGSGSVSTALDSDPVGGDVVVLAVYYPDARAAVERHSDELDGRVVVDVTNPVNDSFDALVVPPDGSATRELAALAGGARFVKAFNTTFARTLVAGEVAGEPLDVLISTSSGSPATTTTRRRPSPRSLATAGSSRSTRAASCARASSRRSGCCT
jgi:8-hydroxy-5-deazaflavin:NADPH oxidoreductase